MEAFEQVYEFYFKDVYKYVLTLCHDAGEAEEITQETFCQALKGMSSFRGECKMLVWLCQIAKHLYFGRQKKQKRMSAQEIEEVLEDVRQIAFPDSIEQRYLDETDAMEIHRHLHNLQEPYKEVFMLRIFGELSFKKIAEIFGRTESWARITYHRAKLRIISEMEDGNGKNNM